MEGISGRYRKIRYVWKKKETMILAFTYKNQPVELDSGLKMTVGNMANETPESGKDTAQATDDEKGKDDAAANAEKAKAKSEDEQKSGQKSIDPAKVTLEAFTDTTNN